MPPRILRFEADGRYLGAFSWSGLPGAAGEDPTLRAIAAAPGGGVYAIQFAGSRILRFDETGTLRAHWVSPADAQRNTFAAHDLVVGPDGRVCVAHIGSPVSSRRGRSLLRCFDPRGQLLWERGFGPGDDPAYAFPEAIAMGPDGRLYMIDTESRALRVFEVDGQERAGWPLGPLWNGADLALSPDGSIYLTTGGEDRVLRLAGDGQMLGEIGVDDARPWPDTTVAGASTLAPDGIFHDFVFEDDRFGLRRRDRFGNPQGQPVLWGGEGSGPAEFGVCYGGRTGTQRLGCANAIAVGPRGAIVVGDAGNRRLQRFAPDGRFEALIGPVDEAGAAILSGVGATLRMAPNGDLLLRDPNDRRLHRLSPDGERLASWGDPDDSRANLRDYLDFVGLPDGEVIALSWQRSDSTHRPAYQLERLSPDGAARVWPLPEAASSTEEPRSLALAPDGSLWVFAMRWPEIRRFDTQGQPLPPVRLEADPDLGSPVYPPSGQFGPDGRLYAWGRVYGAAYPARWHVEFHANPWLTEAPLSVVEWDELNPDYREAAPGPGLPADGFSFRAERVLPLPAGQTVLHLVASGGARLWVGPELLVDDWHAAEVDRHAAIDLPAGEHRVRVEYRDPGGPARLRLTWWSQAVAGRVFLPLSLRR